MKLKKHNIGMKQKKHINIDVYYDASFYPRGDSVIKKITGRRILAAGMGFGRRDINFSFRNLPAALSTFRKLSKLKYPFERVTLTSSYE